MIIFNLICLFPLIFSEATVLDSNNWRICKTGEWLIKFYSNRCPACVYFNTEWTKVVENANELNLTVQFGEIDVDIQRELAIRFLIFALPTLVYVKDGVFYVYSASRSSEEIVSFLNLRRMSDVQIIPGYKSPDSFGIRIMTMTSKVMFWLQIRYSKLVEGGRYPGWLVIFVALLLTMAIMTMISHIIAQILTFIFFGRRNQPRIVVSTSEADQGHLKQS